MQGRSAVTTALGWDEHLGTQPHLHTTPLPAPFMCVRPPHRERVDILPMLVCLCACVLAGAGAHSAGALPGVGASAQRGV